MVFLKMEVICSSETLVTICKTTGVTQKIATYRCNNFTSCLLIDMKRDVLNSRGKYQMMYENKVFKEIFGLRGGYSVNLRTMNKKLCYLYRSRSLGTLFEVMNAYMRMETKSVEKHLLLKMIIRW